MKTKTYLSSNGQKTKSYFALIAFICIYSLSTAQVHVKAPTPQVNYDHVALGPYFYETNGKGVDVKGELYISHVPFPMQPCCFSGTSFESVDVAFGNNDPTFSTPFLINRRSIIRPQWHQYNFIGDAFNEYAQIHSQEVYSTNILLTSDKKLKTNVKPVETALTRVLNLKSYTYDFIHTDNPEMPAEWNEYQKRFKKNQVGFLAQDIQEDFPFLVHYNQAADKYSVNYFGFIPEIVRAMQEQQEMIESLKSELTKLKGANTMKENSVGDFGTTLFGTEKQGVSLAKHAPISAKEEIKINYTLPEGTQEAMLIVYDLTGKQLFANNLNPSEKHVTLAKKKLKAGQYLYTLIANGEEVATHKLIVLD